MVIIDNKNNIVNETQSVINLASSMKKFGRENTIIAFFMFVMITFVGYNQYSNYKVMEDNRTYYKEQKENMKEIVDTNSKLVKILDIEIANIKDSLDMSRDSNTYILEEVITGDGEKILKPRKIKK